MIAEYNMIRYKTLSTKRHLSFLELTSLVFILASIIIAITPDLSRYFPKPLWILLLLVWYIILFFLLITKKASFSTRKSFFVIVLWVLFQLFYKIIGYSSAELGNYFIIIIHFDIVIKSIFIFENYSKNGRYAIWRFIQLFVLALLLINIYWGLTLNQPHFLIFYYPESYIGKNIAQTEFYNMLIFFVGACCLSFFTNKKTLFRTLDLLCIFLSLFFMASFETRATSFFFSLIIILLSAIISFKRQSSRLVAWPLLIVALLASVLVFSTPLASLLPNRVSERIYALTNFINGSAENNALLSRISLMDNSLTTYFSSIKNMIFGIGYHLGDEYYSIIGQHSFLTDTLVAYGIFGLAFAIVYFINVFGFFFKRTDYGITRRYLICAVFLFLILSIVSNSFVPENAFSFYICYSLIAKRKEECSI